MSLWKSSLTVCKTSLIMATKPLCSNKFQLTPVDKKKFIFLGIDWEELNFPLGAIGFDARIFNRKCQRTVWDKNVGGMCGIRHSQGGTSTTDVVFELLCDPSRGEAVGEVSVIDSHCSESICTGWFGSHSNLQSVMQIALGL